MRFHRLFALALLLAAPAAYAVDRVPAREPATTDVMADKYVQFRLGAFMPQSDDLTGFNNGFAADAAFGLRVHPNIAVEAGVAWARSSTDTISDATGRASRRRSR